VSAKKLIKIVTGALDGSCQMIGSNDTIPLFFTGTEHKGRLESAFDGRKLNFPGRINRKLRRTGATDGGGVGKLRNGILRRTIRKSLFPEPPISFAANANTRRANVMFW